MRGGFCLGLERNKCSLGAETLLALLPLSVSTRCVWACVWVCDCDRACDGSIVCQCDVMCDECDEYGVCAGCAGCATCMQRVL